MWTALKTGSERSEGIKAVTIIVALPLVFIDPEVIVHEVRSAKVLYKLFVMSDDHELKVPLKLSSPDNSVK